MVKFSRRWSPQTSAGRARAFQSPHIWPMPPGRRHVGAYHTETFLTSNVEILSKIDLSNFSRNPIDLRRENLCACHVQKSYLYYKRLTLTNEPTDRLPVLKKQRKSIEPILSKSRKTVLAHFVTLNQWRLHVQFAPLPEAARNGAAGSW